MYLCLIFYEVDVIIFLRDLFDKVIPAMLVLIQAAKKLPQ